ncbi:MAG: arylsulfatase A-like enzyme [Verrucomicrobiales bacterium]|jgi:arylsulfatase A-like enzyme
MVSDEHRDWEDHRMATYAGMVDRLDQNIGRVVARLKAKGEFENTLIMFCSDNGACPFERTTGKSKSPASGDSYWTYDIGWAHAGNTPFRWYKQNQHEGGISSPLIVHWPKGLKTKPGVITHQPGHLIDLMATYVDVAAQNKPQNSIQGRSLVPVFNGQTREPHPWLYFHFSNNRALMQAQWKLVSARGGPWELYDLNKDRTELNDLAGKLPERVNALRTQWHKMATEIDKLPATQASSRAQPTVERGHSTRLVGQSRKI